MKHRVYIVEHRSGVVNDAAVAFVASSLQGAHSFCLNNKNFDYGTNWWWAIYSVAVNSLTVNCDDVHFMLPDGRITEEQPIPLMR